MNQNQIITISGDLGSGKSTIAALLGTRLGIPVISTGAFQRELALRKGITSLELNQLAEHDNSIDAEIDAINGEIEKSKVSTIVDSRMGWHFIPSAFKIFLVVDEMLAAERIFSANRDSENAYKNATETLIANSARRSSELIRFESMYGVDISNWKNYDLVVNTSAVSPEVIANEICDHIERAQGSKKKSTYWTSPISCFPTDATAWRYIPDEAVEVPNPNLPQVDLVYVRGTNLIWGSHFEVAEAILLGKPFIQGRVIAFGENALLPNNLVVSRFLGLLPSVSALYDWEEALKFRFYRYPPWFKSAG